MKRGVWVQKAGVYNLVGGYNEIFKYLHPLLYYFTYLWYRIKKWWHHPCSVMFSKTSEMLSLLVSVHCHRSIFILCKWEIVFPMHLLQVAIFATRIACARV
jgi:hypothetical protein